MPCDGVTELECRKHAGNMQETCRKYAYIIYIIYVVLDIYNISHIMYIYNICTYTINI